MILGRNRKLILGSTLSALFVAGGVYASTAFAQSTSPSASPSVSASASASAKPNGRQSYLQHLAQHLNVNVDQLQNAMKAAAHDGVADALKAGRITQDQANQANQRIDSGQGPAGFGGFGRRPIGPRPSGAANPNGGPRGGFAPGQAIKAAAQALKMQPSDLMSQLRQGKSLSDIAKAQNVDLATVTSAITGAVKPQLDQAVQNGRLTQQQETDILNRINSGQFPGPGRGGARPNRSARPSSSASPSASASASSSAG
jgi:hypothetical protein